MKSPNEESIHEECVSDENSGIFDLAELRQLLESETKSDDSGDLIAIGVGRVGIGPLGPAPNLVPAGSKPPPSMGRVLPFVAVMVASMSVAFAMATVHSASPEQAVIPSAGSKASPVVGRTETSPDPVPAIEQETELPTEPEPPASIRERVPVARTTPVGRTERASAPSTTPPTRVAPEPELADRSVDELLRLATGLPVVPNTPPTQSMEETRLLTLRPSRAAVASAFRNVAPAVRRCADDGVATARVFITGATGRARSASVTGVDAATASCVEDAVMRVRVDPFLQDRLEISFPYRL